MDIKGKLAPLFSQAQVVVVDGLRATDAALTRLPRPLRKLSQRQLNSSVAKSLTKSVLAIVSLRTGKALLLLTVKNRELSRFGRVSYITTLVACGVSIVLITHEAFARTREDYMSPEEKIVHAMHELMFPEKGAGESTGFSR